MELTRDDEIVITQYIRDAHDGYDGPVVISMKRLKAIHMAMSMLIASVAIDKARIESRRAS